MAEKILLMSDIHITEPGTQIIGLDPAARFRRCLTLPLSIMRMLHIYSSWAT